MTSISKILPVASVAKVVLGDMLGVGYVIDPRVQGTDQLVVRTSRARGPTSSSSSRTRFG